MRAVKSLQLISILEQSTFCRSRQVTHLYNEYPILFGIRRFVKAHEAARHWTLPYKSVCSDTSSDGKSRYSTYVASNSWIG
jgi:hypothetical protein